MGVRLHHRRAQTDGSPKMLAAGCLEIGLGLFEVRMPWGELWSTFILWPVNKLHNIQRAWTTRLITENCPRIFQGVLKRVSSPPHCQQSIGNGSDSVSPNFRYVWYVCRIWNPGHGLRLIFAQHVPDANVWVIDLQKTIENWPCSRTSLSESASNHMIGGDIWWTVDHKIMTSCKRGSRPKNSTGLITGS